MSSSRNIERTGLSWLQWSFSIGISAISIPLGFVIFGIIALPLGVAGGSAFLFNFVVITLTGGLVSAGQYLILRSILDTTSTSSFLKWVGLSIGSAAIGSMLFEIVLQDWFMSGLLVG